MYKKIMFILLTMLFMSGSCDLGGKKSSLSSKKAHTASKTNTPTTNTLPPSIPTLTDLTPINLVDTHKDAIKFYDLTFSIMIPRLLEMQVSSVLISTTEDALRAAGIASLSEVKSMRDQNKLEELIKSLTFTIESKDVYDNPNAKIIGDYENLKIIYEGLRNNVDDSTLQPKLKINGEDVEFKDGFYAIFQSFSYFVSNNSYYLTFPKNKKPVIIDFLGDVLGINGIEKFKKYLP